jgi:SAM-dependent methyltransferase
VEFAPADALALSFADDSFDGCRADRSLMHVPEARRALAEMLRVTRPGGRIVVYEVDFETLVLDTPHKATARAVVRTWCDSVRDGWLGRRIPGLLRDLGLREVAVWPHTLLLPPALAVPILGPTTVERAVRQGALVAAEGQAWLAHLDELQQGGRFFSTLTGYLVAGQK